MPHPERLGDGCISKHARGVYCIRIALDAAYPGIVNECGEALESVFPDKTARRGKRRLQLRRGIHSDGCRVIATERKGSYVRRAPRYAFSNLSEDIKRPEAIVRHSALNERPMPLRRS